MHGPGGVDPPPRGGHHARHAEVGHHAVAQRPHGIDARRRLPEHRLGRGADRDNLAAVAAFLVYVARTAWPYLATGVAALTLVVPQALLEWTDNALGPAGVLLVTGVTLILAGLAVKSELGDDLEGEVPDTVYEPAVLAAQPVERLAPAAGARDAAPQAALDAEQEAIVMRRLQELGSVE